MQDLVLFRQTRRSFLGSHFENFYSSIFIIFNFCLESHSSLAPRILAHPDLMSHCYLTWFDFSNKTKPRISTNQFLWSDPPMSTHLSKLIRPETFSPEEHAPNTGLVLEILENAWICVFSRSENTFVFFLNYL